MTMLSKSKYRATRGSAETGMSTFRRWVDAPDARPARPPGSRERAASPRRSVRDGRHEVPRVALGRVVVHAEPEPTADRALIGGRHPHGEEVVHRSEAPHD